MQNESSRGNFGSTRVSAYASVCRCTQYSTLYRCKMSARHRYSLQASIALLHLFWHVFVHGFLCNHQFDLELDYIIRKPLVCRIQRYIRHREILSTFHTRVDNRSIRHFAFYSPPNCPFPFDDHHQNLIHPFRARPHLTPQTASQSIYGCRHCSHVRTNRWSTRKSHSISASLIERRANNTLHPSIGGD